MVRGEDSVEIDRPIEAVFGFVATDLFINYPRWSPEVELLEPLDSTGESLDRQQARVALGARARQVRVDHGRRSDTVVEIVSLEPERRIAFASRGQPRFSSAFELTPHGDATALAFRFELSELKLYMRPFESLIRRAIQEGVERTVVNIRELVESELR